MENKKMYLCSRMMKRAKINLLHWFFILLFASYASGISLFTHTHIINNTVYVHSHPFKKGEKNEHTHSGKQLELLDHFYNTIITPDIIPEINLADLSSPRVTPYIDLYETNHLINSPSNILSRGPPQSI